jgi:hypothetical protein
MHQGSGNNSDGGRKREPIAHAMDPGGVSEIGNHVAKNPQSIHAGRGFMAPEPMAEDHHHCGSQGKY